MVYKVTQRRGFRHSRGRFGTLEFDVLADSGDEAESAVPYQSGSSFPGDGSITASQPVSTGITGVHFLVTVDFQGAGTLNLNDLREGEFHVRWEPGVTMEPYEIDYGDDPDKPDDPGIPTMNSVGIPFATTLTRPVNTSFLLLTRLEIFDIVRANRYRNRTNSKPVTIATGAYKAVENVPTGDMLCVNLSPGAEWKLGTRQKVPVTSSFEFRGGGFWEEVLDAGDQGFFRKDDSDANPVELGPFYNSVGQQLTNVPLDGAGAPIDTRIKCGASADGLTWFTAINAPADRYKIPDERLRRAFRPGTNGTKLAAVFIRFRKYKQIDLGTLYQ